MISGSHLYGFTSQDSDVDYRGTYITGTENLLGLRRKRDVIEMKPDIVMFELAKEINLAIKGNCNVLEHINAEPIYRTAESLELKRMVNNTFGKRGLYNSYRGMAMSNYKKFILKQGRKGANQRVSPDDNLNIPKPPKTNQSLDSVHLPTPNDLLMTPVLSGQHDENRMRKDIDHNHKSRISPQVDLQKTVSVPAVFPESASESYPCFDDNIAFSESLFSPCFSHNISLSPSFSEPSVPLPVLQESNISKVYQPSFNEYSEYINKTFYVKKYLYVFRALMAGTHALQTGRIQPNIIELNKYFKIPLVKTLVEHKRAGTESEEVRDLVDSGELDALIPGLFERMDKAYDRCKISEKPDEDGVSQINSWLIQQRVDLIGS